MDGLTAYALALTRIQGLSGPEIHQAVADYLENNPTALQDSLGLQVVDGELCVVQESN